MSTQTATPPAAPSLPTETFADRLRLLGDVPPDRVRLWPPPGTATFDDWQAARDDGWRGELVDATLVELPMGWGESFLAATLVVLFRQAAGGSRLGWVIPPDGFVRLPGGDSVRGPDVAFYARERQPGGRRPTAAVPRIAPDIAVEVLSRSNRPGEMRNKRRDYFAAGTTTVWQVDPVARTIAVYSDVDHCVMHRPGEVVKDDPWLPDLAVDVTALFAELDDESVC